MKAVVTGAAGFIGSHLARTLLGQGIQVVGIDALTPYYPRWMKRVNLAGLAGRPEFTLVEEDLVCTDLALWLDGADYCFHLAAQPGVRSSWGPDFADYTHHNVLATQRVLEAASRARSLRSLVYASSSSVYGRQATLPVREDSALEPVSPYGLTKLSGEHLCRIYAERCGLPIASLRYFTVYGPGQRPDMAFHRFIGAALTGSQVTLYGDGGQTRDFTYVSDAVAATLAAATAGARGAYNIGGGAPVSLGVVLALIEEITGCEIPRLSAPEQAGDPRDTWGDMARAAAELRYRPQVDLRTGVRAQVEWMRTLLRAQPDRA